MTISELRTTEIGQFINDSEEFIVVERVPEDRSSSFTVIWHSKRGRLTYYWDHDNPEVVLKGVGTLKLMIVRKS